MTTKVDVYKDKIGEWRSKIMSENGTIVSVTSGGYTNRSDAQRSLEATRDALNEADRGDTKEFLSE